MTSLVPEKFEKFEEEKEQMADRGEADADAGEDVDGGEDDASLSDTDNESNASSNDSDDDPSSPPPVYSQTATITALTNFYTFLTRLPCIPASALHIPPPSGWPNITLINFAALRKNPEVISLLAHLPYLDLDSQDYWIAPETASLDYHSGKVAKALEKGEIFWREKSGLVPFGVDMPEWVVPLTVTERYGKCLSFDTNDGTITTFILGDPFYSTTPRYAATDTRAWRNTSPCRSIPIAKFFERWTKKYETLQWIAWPMNGWPCVRAEGSHGSAEDFEELKAIHVANGWPEHFDREGCRRALEEWEVRSQQKHVKGAGGHG